MAYAVLTLSLDRMQVHSEMHLADDFSNIAKKSPVGREFAIHANFFRFGTHFTDDSSDRFKLVTERRRNWSDIHRHWRNKNARKRARQAQPA